MHRLTKCIRKVANEGVGMVVSRPSLSWRSSSRRTVLQLFTLKISFMAARNAVTLQGRCWCRWAITSTALLPRASNGI